MARAVFKRSDGRRTTRTSEWRNRKTNWLIWEPSYSIVARGSRPRAHPTSSRAPAYELPGTWLRPPGRRHQIRQAAPGAGSEEADRWEAILAAAGISHEAPRAQRRNIVFRIRGLWPSLRRLRHLDQLRRANDMLYFRPEDLHLRVGVLSLPARARRA